jgi:molecular chaperone GrpE
MTDNRNATAEPQTDHDAPAQATAGPSVSAEELARLRKLAAERDQYLDLAQRTRADFENYQKRNQKDRELDRKYAFGPLVFDLLPVLDNLERTLDAANKAGDNGPLVQGVAMVQKQFLDALKRHGIRRVDAQPGSAFDPNLHQAVMQRAVDGMEPGHIVDVHEQGYMNQDRVLRPAKVTVSAKPG